MAKFLFRDIKISGIASAVPSNLVNLTSCTEKFGKDFVDSFIKESGILSRHLSEELQTASDLGYVAAVKLLERKKIEPADIGLVLFISKTPDYRSPATAAVLHGRLGLSKDCIAFDINIGCAGFIYGLQVGCSILDGVNSKFGLLVVGDTTSKQIQHTDPLSMMFGDGSSAILLEKVLGAKSLIVETKADGKGFNSMINRGGAFRYHTVADGADITPAGMVPEKDYLQIDVNQMATFAETEIPLLISDYLINSGNKISDYGILAFNQVHVVTLSRIAEKLGILPEKLIGNINHRGYTCGNSIPLLLADSINGNVNTEIRVLACGFGEGLSYGLADFVIGSEDILPLIITDESFADGAVSHVF